MTLLKVNGAQLSYTKIGQGPALILVPGANGTGNIFKGVAEELKDRYTVVTYDRRGYGDTVMDAPLPAEAADFDSHYRLTVDAQDVLALTDAISPSQPVFLMGSSSGSIVAAEAFTTAPDRFTKVALHECPTSTVIDQVNARAQNVDAVETALRGDFAGARDKFGAAMKIQPLDAKMMMAGTGTDGTAPDPKRMAGVMYWFKYEILQYTGQPIDWAIFQKNRDKVILLNGTDSKGSTPQTVINAISELLTVPVTIIPGGHLGYAQKPEGFGEVLAAVLDQR
ncbi:alpha/beta fold hydrolase [Lacticaseibacillus yichunensis]|uniref:Alpha/beta fold hydrolase n=1 Tax=Lacticaseibacillus yichunensis TaxID=2486015 RepID=A0ABW4CLX5_9LACO|nr:alpha/beta hydrolase [Lacticaseibacillus yichunensis]